MFTLTALAAFTCAAGADRQITIEASKTLPHVAELSIYRPGDKSPLRSTSSTTILVPDEGPFDVFVTPKGGLPVRIGHKLVVGMGTHTIKLADRLGVIEVFGDSFPRADAIIATATDDPGPGEKDHRPVQRVRDYREEMLVPEGTYSIWVVPASGARVQKVNDNVRVLAGRSVRVE